MVCRLGGMPNLHRFFEGCEIPHVWEKAQDDSRIEPFDVAEYTAIEQAVSIWWLSKNKPLYWKVDQLNAGFEGLNIGQFFRTMLTRHPKMNPSYHDIQLDLPGDDQAVPTADSPAPPQHQS